eukprot:TRINITY_DN38661_c0_g1_i1.p1 TRINITY_DN38661_c0_g1~~TRINITY_DN38661_c0_g1_i1.p1  ORF type:complete len:506 (-),score=58.91 TRINITY_DN38661_c0_g1_i1:214-1731(-)
MSAADKARPCLPYATFVWIVAVAVGWMSSLQDITHACGALTTVVGLLGLLSLAIGGGLFGYYWFKEPRLLARRAALGAFVLALVCHAPIAFSSAASSTLRVLALASAVPLALIGALGASPGEADAEKISKQDNDARTLELSQAALPAVPEGQSFVGSFVSGTPQSVHSRQQAAESPGGFRNAGTPMQGSPASSSTFDGSNAASRTKYDSSHGPPGSSSFQGNHGAFHMQPQGGSQASSSPVRGHRAGTPTGYDASGGHGGFHMPPTQNSHASSFAMHGTHATPTRYDGTGGHAGLNNVVQSSFASSSTQSFAAPPAHWGFASQGGQHSPVAGQSCMALAVPNSWATTSSTYNQPTTSTWHGPQSSSCQMQYPTAETSTYTTPAAASMDTSGMTDGSKGRQWPWSAAASGFSRSPFQSYASPTGSQQGTQSSWLPWQGNIFTPKQKKKASLAEVLPEAPRTSVAPLPASMMEQADPSRGNPLSQGDAFRRFESTARRAGFMPSTWH